MSSIPAIDNVAWPYSIALFGTRPNDNASLAFISKGANFFFGDDSGVLDNQIRFTRTTNNDDASARSNQTFNVADGSTHIVATVSAAGVVKLYKDGVECTYLTQLTGAGSVLSDSADERDRAHFPVARWLLERRAFGLRRDGAIQQRFGCQLLLGAVQCGALQHRYGLYGGSIGVSLARGRR
jgi:hypothetical protein